MSATEKSTRQLAVDALALIETDGDWPSPAYEAASEARRAAAMQQAVKNLARAVIDLSNKVDLLRDTLKPKARKRAEALAMAQLRVAEKRTRR